MFEDFKNGDRDLVNRFNELMAVARQVRNMSGDDTIKVRHTASGINISMDRQRGKATGAGIMWAFCSAVASTGSTLDCYLGKDADGDLVTVNFTLLGGISDLSDGHLSLVDGTPIPVAIRDGAYWCIIPIEGTEDCT